MSNHFKKIAQPLSQEEIEVLDDFLMSVNTSDETMVLTTLDGYLTAVASGPTILKPSEWMPGVWGPTEDHRPEFETMAQAERITELIMRQFNDITETLHQYPEALEPLFDDFYFQSRFYIDGEMWAYGYMQGIDLCRNHWQPLFDDPDGKKALHPIYILGEDNVTPEEELLTVTPPQREEFSKQIPDSAAKIFYFWLPYREAVHERTVATTIRRDQPKIGRNDPCPCGSGKKFKKCCGLAATLH